MVCADNTVVILMRACDRGKSEARGARSAEGAPCEGRVVVRVRSYAITGCHRGAVGLKSSPKDCTACLLQCCRARHGSRGHALAVGPSHCDYWLYRFVQDGLPEGSRLSPILFICMSELLRQLQKDFPHAYMTVCRRRYFVRRRRHVRQQDSSRVSPRPACDAGCSMLHARVVFGRGWACVWRGAGGRGDCGGAGWYALQDAEEASTDAVCSQNCQE